MKSVRSVVKLHTSWLWHYLHLLEDPLFVKSASFLIMWLFNCVKASLTVALSSHYNLLIISYVGCVYQHLVGWSRASDAGILPPASPAPGTELHTSSNTSSLTQVLPVTPCLCIFAVRCIYSPWAQFRFFTKRLDWCSLMKNTVKYRIFFKIKYTVKMET